MHAHLIPHLERLGALAGDSLDELDGVADRNRPRLHHRDRSGADRQWIEKRPARSVRDRHARRSVPLVKLTYLASVATTSVPPMLSRGADRSCVSG